VSKLDTGVVARKRGHNVESYSLLFHKEAVAAAKALGCPSILVWVALMWRMEIEKKATIKLPTKKLREWGVNRWTWTRALRRLEADGCLRRLPTKPKEGPVVEIIRRVGGA
jgi:hypothetical protein